MEWHFSNRTNKRFSYQEAKINMPMKSVWNIKLQEGIIDTPIYANKMIYVSSVEKLYKIDPSNGKILWSIIPDTSIQSSPTYYDGRVYFSSHTKDTLYCVDSQDGKEIWRINTGVSAESCTVENNQLFFQCAKYNGSKTLYGFASYSIEDKKNTWFHPSENWSAMRSCSIAEGVLVYGDIAGVIYALDIVTGEEVWRIKIGNYISFDAGHDHLYSSESPIIIDDIVVFWAGAPNIIFGVDLRSGEIVWTYQPEEQKNIRYHGFAFDKTNLYVLTLEGKTAKQYIALNVKTGEEKFIKNIESIISELGIVNSFFRSGLLVGDYHFLGIHKPSLVAAINKNTGKLIWKQQIGNNPTKCDSMGIYADNKLIWISHGGDVYCFE